ncbi:MAG: YhbY family RNA-binding protein [Luminiphilus sp.]
MIFFCPLLLHSRHNLVRRHYTCAETDSVTRDAFGPLMNPSSSKELRQLRALAHPLRPVVTVAGNGLSASVLQELERALLDHELIKVKVAVGDRVQREAVVAALCEQSGAQLVQRIGNIATLVRRNPAADPRKSNLQRAQS